MKIIEVNNLSKSYQIGHRKEGYLSLRDEFANLVKAPIQWLRGNRNAKDAFWALQDINFSVKKGEVVGIIGRNGAGKSTLLKILSRITPPTKGEAVIRGRVSSLLEVGVGFHPELTGRENIFLNGAILGMTKKEIARKFNQIIEFAGIQEFIETPVKHYSSGMYVRLAFSVAAHMDPDILLVDEVLAVGDYEFQKKCLGKMNEVTKKAGRTILFVSHNMGAIQNLCKRCILIDKGKIKMIGKTRDVVEEYIHSNTVSRAGLKCPEDKNKIAQILSIEIKNATNELSSSVNMEENWQTIIRYKINQNCPKTIITLEFFSTNGTMFYFTTDNDSSKILKDKTIGEYEATVNIPRFFLNPGDYYLRIAIQSPCVVCYDKIENIFIKINSKGEDVRTKYFGGKYLGFISTILDWQTIKNQ